MTDVPHAHRRSLPEGTPSAFGLWLRHDAVVVRACFRRALRRPVDQAPTDARFARFSHRMS